MHISLKILQINKCLLIIYGLENVKNSGITKYYFQWNTNKKSQEAMTPPGF